MELLLLVGFLSVFSVVQGFQNGGVVSTDVGGRFFSEFQWQLNAIPILQHLNNSHVQCGADSVLVLQEASRLEEWALKIIDSSARWPSGVLSGNLNQYGDFDECLSADSAGPDQPVQGKYCLASVLVDFKGYSMNNRLRKIDHLIHSHRHMTSELRDPGHRIPKLGSFSWGLCIPSSCTNQDLVTAVSSLLSNVSYANIEISVSDDLCYTRNKTHISAPHYIALFSFLTVLWLTCFATWRSYSGHKSTSKLNQFADCFSLKSNWNVLTSTTAPTDDIPALHGARALNALALLLSHKQMAQMYNPVINRTAMAEMMDGAWSMIGRSAILYTDTFILMSGFLASYAIVKQLDNGKKLRIREKYIARFLRFTPNLAAIILFCTYILPYLGSGPQWGQVIDKYSNFCTRNMWKNLLYIHNYFGFEEMCLTHTHQLGIDMQLFIAAPLLVYLLWRFPKSGTLMLTCIAVLSTWLRYSVTYSEGLSTVIHYGITVSRLFKTARLSYILPTHRATVYVIGLILGYYLQRGGRSLLMRPATVAVGWTLATTAGLFAMFGPYHMAKQGYTYNPLDAAKYNAFSPILWSAFIAWGLVACVNGYGGWFNELLGWKYFRVFSRIAYAVYLTQFPVFFYYVGTQRTAIFYGGFHSLFDWSEFAIIIASSVLLTLLFDIPFQNARKVFLTGHVDKTSEETPLTIQSEIKMEMTPDTQTQVRRRQRG